MTPAACGPSIRFSFLSRGERPMLPSTGLHVRWCRREAIRRMERSLFWYIFQHTWRNQVLLLIVTALSFPLIYVNLAIPKEIVNNAIAGKHIPKTVLGFDVTQVSYLMILS